MRVFFTEFILDFLKVCLTKNGNCSKVCLEKMSEKSIVGIIYVDFILHSMIWLLFELSPSIEEHSLGSWWMDVNMSKRVLCLVIYFLLSFKTCISIPPIIKIQVWLAFNGSPCQKTSFISNLSHFYHESSHLSVERIIHILFCLWK